jgi:hypothetical protein
MGWGCFLQALSQIVLNDQSRELHMHALSLLVEHFNEKSIPTLQQASHDPDSRVAQKAGQFLYTFSAQ